MERYDDPREGVGQDGYHAPSEFAHIAYMSGRADALLEAEEARRDAADAAGDRIVHAAQSREMRGLWGDDVGWQESGALLDDDQGYDDDAVDDEYDGGERW